MVTAVTLDAAGKQVVQEDNTTVSGLDESTEHPCLDAARPVVAVSDSWSARGLAAVPAGWHSLSEWPPPLTFYEPPPQPKWDYTNASAKMIVDLSGFYQALDQEPLVVRRLQSGNYELKINGQTVGQFSAAQFEQGINLAEYRTPMLLQAYDLRDLVYKEVQWRFYAWRAVQLQFASDHDPAVQRAARQTHRRLVRRKR